ncbi:MAG: NAD(P)-dependent alcohol dehydrogenase [Candidatus Limnocylindria bacterium]
MKAIVYHEYGSPDVLRLDNVPMPNFGDDGVLVRVGAASVNALDWHFLRGQPYIVRTSSGLRTPKRNIPGVDVAGVVEAIGSGVTSLRVGDEVWGERSRACAEYVAGPERLFIAKPAKITLEEAAAIPAAGITALQALRDKGNLKPGQKVLINGASGGVGTFAVQIAKADGAEVTGVTSSPNVEMVRSLGADHVVDYTAEDFTRGSARYDLIIDNAGNRSLRSMRRVLASDGALVLVGASKGKWVAPIARIVAAGVMSQFGSQRLMGHLTDTRREDLEVMNELVASGKVKPAIDRCYPLAEVPEAIRYLETMRARAKVIIQV